MAFFTRVNLNVPVIPPDEAMDKPSSALGHDHRRYASEPSRTTSSRSSSTHNHASRKSSGPPTTNSEPPTSNVSVTRVLAEDQIERDPVKAEAAQPSDAQKPEDDKDGEPQRYEYVVDRVLGVEV